MIDIVPSSKPKLSRADAEKLVARTFKTRKELSRDDYPVVFLGIRGYYRDSMGAAGRNDRGIYDDAIFIVSQNTFAAFNANTDPSVTRPGVATLVPGVHLYKKGKHGITKPGGGYPAFRPATKDEALPVTRDGETGVKEGIAINIHKGSRNSTSSLGCQTIYPEQWDAFQTLAYSELTRFDEKIVPYVLVDDYNG